MAIKKKTNKNVKYYLNLPWTYTIETEMDEKDNPIYVIRVNELEGIVTDAPTIEEGMKLIKEAMQAAFKMYIENKEEIPEPKMFEQYKGNIAYRTTSLRHYSLVKEAQKKNVSISQLIDTAIDSALKKR
jgi:predicted RNase H-like HicB family nuclease